MVKQNKNSKLEKYHKVTRRLGLAVMALATVFSMAELTDREGHQLAVALQPSYAYANQNLDSNEQGNQASEQRRSGKEEIRHSSATYGTVMRSHSVSGKA